MSEETIVGTFLLLKTDGELLDSSDGIELGDMLGNDGLDVVAIVSDGNINEVGKAVETYKVGVSVVGDQTKPDPSLDGVKDGFPLTCVSDGTAVGILLSCDGNLLPGK